MTYAPPESSGEIEEFSRDELRKEITHDYSTSLEGIVPLSERRPQRYFIFLWITLAAGLAFLFQGFTYYAAGYSIWKMLAATILGSAIYIAFAVPSAYLGGKSGQTMSLLTRSIFGLVGSWIVSLFIIFPTLGWVGFQANLLAQMYNGLYGWTPVVWIGVIFAVLMITNNAIGFTGITAFARYVGAPLIVLWIGYLVIKSLSETSLHTLSSSPHVTAPLSFTAGIVLSIGFIIWGNEADLFRYGKPKPFFSLPAYVIGLISGQILFPLAGWIIAERAHSPGFGPALKYLTGYSVFGATILAVILLTVQQISVNDGNYYEATNPGQNLLGGWAKWNRLYTCALMAIGGGFGAWLIPHITNGFEKLASFLAVTIPCATVILCVDYFLLPKLFGIKRPMDRVPAWRDTATANWPAIIALLVAVAFGSYGSGIWPGESASRLWGIAPLEAWLLAGLVYLGIVAVVRRGPSVARALGFPYMREAQETASTSTPVAAK